MRVCAGMNAAPVTMEFAACAAQRKGQPKRMMNVIRRALILLLAAALVAAGLFSAQAEGSSYAGESISQEGAISEEMLAAEAAILIDAGTGTVLFEKNADRAMYPASTTKIMTCLLALEYGHLNDTVTIPGQALNVPADSSLMPVRAGEEMMFIDLLYGLMIHSGNDSAVAIAVIVGGSEKAFVEMMNAKAAELGMTGTHFANPHGYHEDDHYTTARDLAILARAAMQNPEFRKIVGTPGYIIEPTNKRTERLKMVNSNLMLISESEYYYEGMTGIKTGFTGAAGQTFVFSAEREGASLIGVNMKTGSNKDDPQRWADTRVMLDHGFSRYSHFSFADLYAMSPATVQIADAVETDPYGGELLLNVANVMGEFDAACIDGDSSAVLADFQSRRQYTISADLTAPIAEGTIVGSVSYTDDDGQTATGTLVASRSIERQPDTLAIADFLPFLDGVDLTAAGQVLKAGGIVLIAFLILRSIVRARRRARRRAQRRAAARRKGAAYNGSYRGGRDRYYS